MDCVIDIWHRENTLKRTWNQGIAVCFHSVASFISSAVLTIMHTRNITNMPGNYFNSTSYILAVLIVSEK